jgi:8-oxo-dGTP pyrophosphatase MutT (NUDIX family)
MPHIHEKVDFTVEVFIVYNNTVLLRKHDKYKIWLSVGGHIELDEDPNQAALREVREEVGLPITLVGEIFDSGNDKDFKELLPPRFLNRHRINGTHEHVTMVYFATTPTNEIRQGSGEISDELHWFTRADLGDPKYELRENIQRYAKKALEELGNLV